MLVVGFFPFRHIDVQGIHRSLEGLWAAHGARQFRTAEYVEKLVGEEQRAVPAVHLKTAHAHAGHLQDLGELAARAQHFVAERLDGARQCVQLCDIRFLQAGGAAGSVARTSAASLTMGCETERTVIRIVTRLVRTMDASSASIISSVSCLSANSVRPGTAPSRTH